MIREPFDTDLASSPRWIPLVGLLLVLLLGSSWGGSFLGLLHPAIALWAKIVCTALAVLAVTFGAVAHAVGAEAAIIHDKIYRRMEHPRRMADEMFLEGLIDKGVPTALAVVMYRMVRLAGRSAYPSTPQPMSWERRP